MGFKLGKALQLSVQKYPCPVHLPSSRPNQRNVYLTKIRSLTTGESASGGVVSLGLVWLGTTWPISRGQVAGSQCGLMRETKRGPQPLPCHKHPCDPGPGVSSLWALCSSPVKRMLGPLSPGMPSQPVSDSATSQTPCPPCPAHLLPSLSCLTGTLQGPQRRAMVSQGCVWGGIQSPSATPRGTKVGSLPASAQLLLWGWGQRWSPEYCLMCDCKQSSL